MNISNNDLDNDLDTYYFELLGKPDKVKDTDFSNVINRKVAVTPYPFFTLMPAQGRRVCYYNMDGDLTA
jgi:hypothetical protein